MNLKTRASKAVLWSFIDRAAQSGLQLVVSLCLARLLQPSEVGLIGMLWVFVSVVWICSDAGFCPTLIQKQDATETDECSIFYFNLAVSTFNVVLLWFAAPYIADFYRVPELRPVLRAVAFMMPLSAPGLIPACLLSKRLDLHTQAKASIAAAAVSGVVAVIMAYSGYGVWSLVAQILVQSATRTVALWFYCSWRPKLLFSWASLRGMFPFGSRVLSSAFLNAVFDNLYPTVIGKLYSSQQLGFFTLATRIPQTLSGSLTTIVSRVSIPMYPSLRSEPERFKRALRKTVSLTVIVNTPLLVGIAVVAHPLVSVLLTPKWVPAIPYLQIYCLVMILSPLRYAYLDAILGWGNAGLHFRLGAVEKVLSVINLVVGHRWGITGLLLGQAGVDLAVCILQGLCVSRTMNYSLAEQLRDILPGSLVTLAMAVAVAAVSQLPLAHEATNLFLQVTVGAATFLALCRLFRLKAFADLLEVASHSLRRTDRSAAG